MKKITRYLGMTAALLLCSCGNKNGDYLQEGHALGVPTVETVWTSITPPSDPDVLEAWLLGCFDPGEFVRYDRIHRPLLADICSFMRKYEIRKAYIHSSARGACALLSQHDQCRAVDLRFDSYAGMEMAERYQVWLERDAQAVQWFSDNPMCLRGFGRYVETAHPFWHWDHPKEGYRCHRRWCRIGPEGNSYTGAQECIDFAEDAVNNS